MRQLITGLLAIALVTVSTNPLSACHHRRRGCGGECGCASSCSSESNCGGGCSSCNTGCSAGCTSAIPSVQGATYAAAPPVYTAPIASVGRRQPTPPPTPPTDPHANLSLAQGR